MASRLLEKLYYDPKTGYVGVQKLYQKAKAKDPSITLKAVKEWFSSQLDIQRYQEQPKRFIDFKIASWNPDSWQMDLAFWPGLGTKPILTAVNINSRLGYAKILSNKQASTVLSAIKAFVKKHKPKIVTSDNGTEFTNQLAESFFKAQKVEHYNAEPGDHTKMGKIERFNRTIKQRLMKMDRKVTSKLIDDIVYNYNSTEHRSIGMTPDEAKGTVIQSELEHNERAMEELDSQMSTGTSVLYRLKKGAFDKEGARWSKAVYTITGIDGYRLEIRSKNSHILYKPANELKVVNAEATDVDIAPGEVVEVEEILNHKKMRNGKNQFLIKWVGIDEPT